MSEDFAAVGRRGLPAGGVNLCRETGVASVGLQAPVPSRKARKRSMLANRLRAAFSCGKLETAAKSTLLEMRLRILL